MNVLFRCDSSAIIGAGHLMRDLALAQALRRRGSKVEFVCRPARGDAIGVLESAEFKVYRLLESGADEASDAAGIAMWLDRQGVQFNWLVVDHYGLGSQWESSLRSRVGRILVIDDLANRAHDCDVLLDQNFHLDPTGRYKALLPDACVTLFGPHFALIRSEFAQERAKTLLRNGLIRRLFVSFGGADSGHETFRTVAAILNIDKSIHIEVVVGRSYSRFDELDLLCSKASNISLYRQPDHIARLMNEADIAIGAGGITTWERCCLKLPAIVISNAPNQEPSMQAMATAQNLVYLGRAGEVTGSAINDSLRRLIDDPQEVRRLSLAAGELVDGKGCELVASVLLRPLYNDEPSRTKERSSVSGGPKCE